MGDHRTASERRLGTVTVRAERDGADFVLQGTKSPVEAAAQSDYLLVTGAIDDGLAQFLVPADAAGVEIAPLQSIDLVRRYATVQLDGVRVPAASAVGELGNADADVERQLQLAAVVQTAESVGAAQVVFDMTVDWAFSRYSFGRPLASYQELKHRFADMKMWLEASHALAPRLPPRGPGRGAERAGDHQRCEGVLRRLRSRSSSRTACRCTAASASPTTTTSTCTCAE